MVRINRLFHLLINRVYWGYSPLILTCNPNLLTHLSKSADVRTAGPLRNPLVFAPSFAENTSLYPPRIGANDTVDRERFPFRALEAHCTSQAMTSVSVQLPWDFPDFPEMRVCWQASGPTKQALSIVARPIHQTIISLSSPPEAFISPARTPTLRWLKPHTAESRWTSRFEHCTSFLTVGNPRIVWKPVLRRRHWGNQLTKWSRQLASLLHYTPGRLVGLQGLL